MLALATITFAAEPPKLPYVYTKWKHFTVEDGLPNDHIFAVKVDGPRVWVGTEDGLAMIDKRTGKIKSWTEKDGLPWRVITAIDVDKKTGDVWLGLFGGGLARFSGGRFDHWHQLNSGLVNDVVYGVAVQDEYVWAATTAGASRYNTVTGEWTIFTEKNSPMEEIWNYNVAVGKGKVYLAVWGSGVLEYDLATGRWKDYLDPDGEMEIDLYRDDGIVHVIVTSASPADDVVWISTYFGACRYDGRHWRGYYNQDSGLASDFINNAKGRSADEAWFATDKGLAYYDGTNWAVYRPALDTHAPEMTVRDAQGAVTRVPVDTAPAHHYILGLDFQGDDLWVATAHGLSHGIRIRTKGAKNK